MMLVFGFASLAEARTEDDCRRAWSRGVRSYLTKNRRAGPDGKVPKNLDEEELMAQAWDAAFSPACKLEAEGKKPEARIEAAMIGVKRARDQVAAMMNGKGPEFQTYAADGGRKHISGPRKTLTRKA